MYLEDIQLSMSRISEYTIGLDFKTFNTDYKTLDAVVRNFEIIGEAARNLPNSIKEKYTSVPWQEMYYLRNKVGHEYFGVDYEIIWDLAKNYIPENKVEIDTIIKEESKN